MRLFIVIAFVLFLLFFLSGQFTPSRMKQMFKSLLFFAAACVLVGGMLLGAGFFWRLAADGVAQTPPHFATPDYPVPVDPQLLTVSRDHAPASETTAEADVEPSAQDVWRAARWIGQQMGRNDWSAEQTIKEIIAQVNEAQQRAEALAASVEAPEAATAFASDAPTETATPPEPPDPVEAWLNTPGESSEVRLRDVVQVGPFATRTECDEATNQQLVEIARRYASDRIGKIPANEPFPAPTHELRERLVRDSSLSTHDTSVGKMLGLATLVEIDATDGEWVIDQWDGWRRQRGVRIVAGTTMGVIGLLFASLAVLKAGEKRAKSN
ncbi:hypothetical protein [Pseudobythopirellula maris]|uniref:hypothetical protein n=1 Tax=Pseudobythopirellula maris TaxID=2527991 RepID=UPI0011B3C32D|nr:hypothetical protein [Pseudobythopirellula maris]